MSGINRDNNAWEWTYNWKYNVMWRLMEVTYRWTKYASSIDINLHETTCWWLIYVTCSWHKYTEGNMWDKMLNSDDLATLKIDSYILLSIFKLKPYLIDINMYKSPMLVLLTYLLSTCFPFFFFFHLQLRTHATTLFLTIFKSSTSRKGIERDTTTGLGMGIFTLF